MSADGRSAFLVSLATPLAMVLGLCSNIVIVRAFGVSSTLDAYFVAHMVVTLASGLIAEFLGRNFIPTLDRLKQEDSDESVSTYVSAIVTLAILLATVIMLVLGLLHRSVIDALAPGLAANDAATAATGMLIMMPAIALACVNTLHEYLLQARRMYARAHYLKLVFPAVSTLIVLTGASTLGVQALSWAFLASHTLLFLLLLPGQFYRYRPQLGWANADVRLSVSTTAWLLASGLVSRSRGVLERHLASLLGPGVIAALALAQRFSAPVQQAASTGIKVVAFRKISDLVAKGRLEEAGGLSMRSVSVVLLVLVPIAAWLALDSPRVVSLLSLGKDLPIAQRAMLTEAATVLFMAAPVMAVGPILSNVYFALHKPMVVILAAPLTLSVYCGLLFVLYPLLGLRGLLYSNWGVFFVSFMCITAHQAKLLPGFYWRPLWIRLVAYSALAYVLAAAAVQITTRLEIHFMGALLLDGLAIVLFYLSILMLAKDDAARYFVVMLGSTLGFKRRE